MIADNKRLAKKQEMLDKILVDQFMRKEYFEHDFPAFFQYHYGWAGLKDFHKEMLDMFHGPKNLLLVTMRALRKTTIARGYAVWCIAYAKEPYIVVQSYEGENSASWVRSVAKMLMEPSIIHDYGQLFPYDIKREEMMKASLHNFNSTTGVKIESRSLKQRLRGAAEYEIDEHTRRPTLLILDDIDVNDSVKNVDIIQANYDKLKTETIGALDPTHRRIIFLANVIAQDGIAVRFANEYKDKETWHVWHKFLYDGPNNSNIWPEEFNEAVIKQLRDDGTTSFNANYLGIAMIAGNPIIKQTQIRRIAALPLEVKEKGRCVGGIDPAFSTNTGTDEMAITFTYRFENKKYIYKCYGFEGDDKDEERFCNFVASMYKALKCTRLYIEGNNGGDIIYRMLKKRGCACELLKSSKDKTTRLLEHEGEFDREEIIFVVSDDVEKLIEQLVAFPNVAKDDRVDSFVNSLYQGKTHVTG